MGEKPKKKPRGLRPKVDNIILMWMGKKVHEIPQQVASEPGLGLTMWVDAEQNDVVSSEPTIGNASRKACDWTLLGVNHISI